MKKMDTKQAYRYLVKHPNKCIKCCEESFKETGIEAYQLSRDGVGIDVIKRGRGVWEIGETITFLDFTLNHIGSSFDYLNIDYHHNIEYWNTHRLVDGIIIENSSKA